MHGMLYLLSILLGRGAKPYFGFFTRRHVLQIGFLQALKNPPLSESSHHANLIATDLKSA